MDGNRHPRPLKIRLGLRARTLGPVLGGVCLIALAFGWTGFRILMDRFDQIEFQDVAEARERGRQAMADRSQELETKGRDWSRWDDAVSWLEGRNPRFPKSNIEDSALAILKQDALFYWKLDLTLAAGMARTGVASYDTTLEETLRGLLAAGRSNRTFLVRDGRRLHLATLLPVLPASGKGPTRGWFALAREVGSGREDKPLSRVLQTPVELCERCDATEIMGRDSAVLAVKLPVEGGDSAVLRIRLDRPLARLGRDTGRKYLRDFAFAVVLTVLLGFALLEFGVIRRIGRLSRKVEGVGDDQGPDAPFDDGVGDEIGDLARSIDGMVERRERSRKELEVALRESESAARARGQFLASMTHELRTPLNGVIGMTEMAMKGSLDPEQREALSLSRGAALGLLETINGILEYSRLEKGAVELVPEDADLAVLVMDSVRILGPAADSKGVVLRVLCDPALPRVLRFDPARVRQILSNLVGNAVKFTLRGSVEVSLRVVLRTAGEVDLRIEVADTGVGIPLDRQKAVFEPFEQSSPETAVRFGGTGLGLTMARDLVRAMGGRIELESEPGKGSRFAFEIRLPIVDPNPIHEGIAVPSVGVRLRLSDEAVTAHFQEWLRALGIQEGEGILLTDSPQKAISDPGPAVVLVGSHSMRGARALLEGGRTLILSSPCPMKAVFAALEKVSRPDPSIVLCASGLVLREVVRGMLEREGLRVEDAKDPEEATRLVFQGADLVVFDADDPVWSPLDALGPRVLRIGGSDPDGSGFVPKPVKADDLLREVFRAAGMATSTVPKSGSSLDWSSALE